MGIGAGSPTEIESSERMTLKRFTVCPQALQSLLMTEQSNAELRAYWLRRNAEDRARFPSLSDEDIAMGMGEDLEELYAEDEGPEFCLDFPNCGGCSVCNDE